MAGRKIQVSLATPEEQIYEGMVDSLIVPAESGSLGILPGHIPIIAQLSIGIVKLGTKEGPRYFGIEKGYIEFLFNKANILTERVIETKYEERDKVLKELKKEYEIVQELTEDTKKVAKAVASLKTLRN
ncbi:MAG: ATP synthase F1 subunit epsilon [Actinobacteria bacterium]|nr:ATP synthase F1 subunit epsilon [Actinomycetota bacterium]